MKENGIDYNDDLKADLVFLEKEAKTVILLAVNGKIAGILAIADAIKEEFILAIRELESMGIKTAMLLDPKPLKIFFLNLSKKL